jgi:O-methyltransferase involved in polyketide biosynthesis
MTPENAPPGVDPTTPNVARMQDYYLGGKDNFEVDREAADAVMKAAPEVPMIAVEGRKFRHRVVRFLVEAGIRQLVDIGTGLPTQGSVHECAHAVAPDTRVAYIDHDPMVIAHAQALLTPDHRTTVIRADLREPCQIVQSEELNRLIDLSEPTAFLLLNVLHFVTDDAIALASVARLRDTLVPGGYLALSHAFSDMRPEATLDVAGIYQGSGAIEAGPRTELRTRAEVTPYLDGLELVEPGLVTLPTWRPEPGESFEDPDRVWVVAGVGRKV